MRVFSRLDDAALANLAEVIHQLQTERAIASGDHDRIVEQAFEFAFGGDGLGVSPWIEGQVVVCPGAIISKSRSSHRCRFVSVEDVWVWESSELIQEVKRSSPGSVDGFRAVALVPARSGLRLDVVSGRARAGQHSVDKVVSYQVRRGELVEVAQRNVSAAGMK